MSGLCIIWSGAWLLLSFLFLSLVLQRVVVNILSRSVLNELSLTKPFPHGARWYDSSQREREKETSNVRKWSSPVLSFNVKGGRAWSKWHDCQLFRSCDFLIFFSFFKATTLCNDQQGWQGEDFFAGKSLLTELARELTTRSLRKVPISFLIRR